MSPKHLKNIRYFKKPVPVRELGIVTYRHFVKQRLLDKLKDEILMHVPAEMKQKQGRQILDIELL
jgi:LysR family hydrogen peroxide-inducible transcriptional activator